VFNPVPEVADSEDGHLTAGRVFPNEAQKAGQNEVQRADQNEVQRVYPSEVLMTVFPI
jgi:hypothetical protein